MAEQTNQEKIEGVDLVDWDSKPDYPQDPTEEGRDNRFPPRLSMEESVKYQIRILGKVYSYRMHFEPFIAVVGPNEEEDPAWLAGNVPKLRYCCYIWDRLETDPEQRVKTYEFGGLFYKKLKEHYELTGAKPGGPDSPDWIIQYTDPEKINEAGKKYKDSRSRSYSVTNVVAKPFTDDEKTFIKAMIDKYPEIPELKKPQPPEIVAAMWEDSQKMKPGDPKPGTKGWWAKRREAAEAETSEQRSPEPSDEQKVADANDLIGGDGDDEDGVPW